MVKNLSDLILFCSIYGILYGFLVIFLQGLCSSSLYCSSFGIYAVEVSTYSVFLNITSCYAAQAVWEFIIFLLQLPEY